MLRGVKPRKLKALPMKPLEFLGSSRDDLAGMPAGVRHDIGLELMRVQLGGQPTDFKPMSAVGAGTYEIRVRDASGAFRAVYVAKLEAAIYVLRAFQKKTPQTSKVDIELAKVRYRMIGGKFMSRKTDPRFSDTRRIKGSGNVFIDLGFDPAEAKIMALRAEVMIRMEQYLKAQGWTQAEAARRLGITQPRVSRLIKGRWQDFSLDMLLTLAARAGLEPKLRLAA
jgi:phage-related protein/predicted XRE-type DNA-binding protein